MPARSGRPVPRHAVPRLREVLRGPAVPRDAVAHGPDLRHLPGQPPGRLGQGVRRDPGGRASAAAADLRRLMNLAQIVQSHALSFFHLSSPDLLLGMDADPATRNIFGLMRPPPASSPATASACASSASRSSSCSAASASTRPGWSPAASSEPLTAEARRRSSRCCRTRWRSSSARSPGSRRRSSASRRRSAAVRQLPSLFMGLVDERRRRRPLRRPAAGRSTPTARSSSTALDPTTYQRVHRRGRRAVARYPEVGLLQAAGLSGWHLPRRPAGPAERRRPMGTPRADAELGRVPRARPGAVPSSSFHYHYARLIEILYAFERIEQLLREPGHPVAPGARPRRASTTTRASAWPRRRAAR